MKISGLKEWINSLPEHLQDFNIVIREVLTIKGDNDEDLTVYKDIPMTFSGIDEDNKEAFFTDEESAQLIIKQYKEE